MIIIIVLRTVFGSSCYTRLSNWKQTMNDFQGLITLPSLWFSRSRLLVSLIWDNWTSCYPKSKSNVRAHVPSWALSVFLLVYRAVKSRTDHIYLVSGTCNPVNVDEQRLQWTVACDKAPMTQQWFTAQQHSNRCNVHNCCYDDGSDTSNSMNNHTKIDGQWVSARARSQQKHSRRSPCESNTRQKPPTGCLANDHWVLLSIEGHYYWPSSVRRITSKNNTGYWFASWILPWSHFLTDLFTFQLLLVLVIVFVLTYSLRWPCWWSVQIILAAMKSSASFRLHTKPSKSPSQDSTNDSHISRTTSNETSCISSSSSRECFVPIPKNLLLKPLEDFDLPNNKVCLQYSIFTAS